MIPIRLENLRAVPQSDPHSCGFCSLSAIYKYYGLRPEEYRLRELLGTDTSLPYNTPLRDMLEGLLDKMGWDALKGTHPMDILAVLYWHGFDTDCKVGSYERYKPSLRTHLKSNHPVLALTNDMAHWVVITGMDDDGVWIADSSGYLDPTSKNRHCYRITHETTATLFKGLIFVKRGKRSQIREMNNFDFAREYARGAGFGLGCLGAAVPVWIKQLLPEQ